MEIVYHKIEIIKHSTICKVILADFVRIIYMYNKIRPLNSDHLGLSCRPMRWDLPMSMCVPNLKQIWSFYLHPFQRYGWMREACAQYNAWISVVFYLTPTKSGVNIVEWSLLNANVICFRGTSKQSLKQRFCWIISHVVWEVLAMSVFRRLRKCVKRRKKKHSVKYNYGE